MRQQKPAETWGSVSFGEFRLTSENLLMENHRAHPVSIIAGMAAVLNEKPAAAAFAKLPLPRISHWRDFHTARICRSTRVTIPYAGIHLIKIITSQTRLTITPSPGLVEYGASANGFCLIHKKRNGRIHLFDTTALGIRGVQTEILNHHDIPFSGA